MTSASYRTTFSDKTTADSTSPTLPALTSADAGIPFEINIFERASTSSTTPTYTSSASAADATDDKLGKAEALECANQIARVLKQDKYLGDNFVATKVKRLVVTVEMVIP